MRSLNYFGSLLVLIFFFISCQKEKQIPNFRLPKNEEVNEIIKALINSDSLEIAPYLGKKKKISFCEDLQKLRIDHVEKNKLPKKAEGESELIELLIGLPDIPREKFFFSKSDSLYIEFQNKNFNAFKISQNDFNEVDIKSIQEVRNDIKNVKYFSYYYATIPIISLDGKKAYVKYILNCSGLCGAGYRVFLEKKKGKWVVVKYSEEWVS
ncbi:hypothetical protein [Flavobacterium sp. LC2016-01]|uniref:hypothetical protein n=1 Tax=Flavobacterium sp. LC2016-01 TaxID=2675876 RepID=UPI0012BA5C10|nr:hypothetical protein [Flavobacterium sp. LC2016-01]MTH16656.1 hypothetical protein [Flavobacterium sp. LC2016-01]